MSWTDRVVALFPVWVTALSLVALWRPEGFAWLTGGGITVLLGVIMLGMGLTLRVEDFTRVASAPIEVLTGVALQFTVMPLLGWACGRLFGLEAAYAVGLILVACCPGGTASNIVAWIARADVALSVSMTALSTMAAIVLTPVLTTLLVGDRFEVDSWGLFRSCVTVILLPVSLGVALRRWAPGVTERVLPVAPVVAVAGVSLIVAAIMGAGRERMLTAFPALLGSIVVLHGAGFALGYTLSGLATRREATRRTVAIEVGMQNSGLGAQLARANFEASVATVVAIPAALSALTHCILGSLLAGWWSRRAPAEESGDAGNAA